MSVEYLVYQDSQLSVPSTLKDNRKFQILLGKIFSLKQKLHQASIINLAIKITHPFRNGIT